MHRRVMPFKDTAARKSRGRCDDTSEKQSSRKTTKFEKEISLFVTRSDLELVPKSPKVSPCDTHPVLLDDDLKK